MQHNFSFDFQYGEDKNTYHIKPLTVECCQYLAMLEIGDENVAPNTVTPIEYLITMGRLTGGLTPASDLDYFIEKDQMRKLEKMIKSILIISFGCTDCETIKLSTPENIVKAVNEIRENIGTIEDLLNGKYYLMRWLHITPQEIDKLKFYEFKVYTTLK